MIKVIKVEITTPKGSLMIYNNEKFNAMFNNVLIIEILISQNDCLYICKNIPVYDENIWNTLAISNKGTYFHAVKNSFENKILANKMQQVIKTEHPRVSKK